MSFFVPPQDVYILNDQISENRQYTQLSQNVSQRTLWTGESISGRQQQLQDGKIQHGQDSISSFIQSEVSVIREVGLNHKEIQYFALNLQKEKQHIETKYKCNIDIELQSDKPDILQINYQDKCFKIIQGDIQKLKSEAVVNTSNQFLEFGNPSMQTGVAKKIQQLGGIRYEKACKDYIKNNSALQFGTVFAHHHQAVLIQYILTVATPFYQQGSKTDQDLQLIEQNIQAIFWIADQLQIKEITLPIIGGSTAGFQFSSAAQTVISSVIDTLYSQNTKVKAAYIIEIDPQKILKIVDITQKILNYTPKRQVKYQWKWFDNYVLKDYDDEEVNEQIDINYEQFQLDKDKKKMELIFPISKQPGTHIVDLTNNTLIDKSFNTFIPIKLESHKGRKKYFFGNEPVSEQLNEFMFISNNQGIRKFEIFYKTYQIIFKDCNDISKMQELISKVSNYRQIKSQLKQTQLNQQLLEQQQLQLEYSNLKEWIIVNQQIIKRDYSIQINQVTKYTRPIFNFPYRKRQKQDRGCILRGKSYELIQQFTESEYNKSYLTVEQINQNNFDKISKKIRKNIHKNHVQVILSIPQMENADLYTLTQLINDNSLETEGQVRINNIITITITPQIKQDIMKHIQESQIRYQETNQLLGSQIESTYPREWIAQDSNFLKVQLLSTDAEYQKIESLFKETDPNGKVYAISRIQNQTLWANYFREKRKILKFYRERNQDLNSEELELYAWHGTTNQHPSIIYDSDREGFNPEYSNDQCLWGPACYFAEKASYSRHYSYVLKTTDDTINQGKKIFLCCLLTTGRSKKMSEDKKLRRPPGDFDSVTGFTRGSTVYMLYQMSARRAYPAYEVIYE